MSAPPSLHGKEQGRLCMELLVGIVRGVGHSKVWRLDVS
jgi:hypothetical protein